MDSTLFDRARTSLSRAERNPVSASAHVLRHTAITGVCRIAGYPVPSLRWPHPPTVTGRYLHATLDEIATALAREAHPSPPDTDDPLAPCRRR